MTAKRDDTVFSSDRCGRLRPLSIDGRCSFSSDGHVDGVDRSRWSLIRSAENVGEDTLLLAEHRMSSECSAGHVGGSAVNPRASVVMSSSCTRS